MREPDGWKLIGKFGVDAGLVWIGDPCYILHKEGDQKPQDIGEDWDDFCKILDDKVYYDFNSLGVVASTGYGDGIYPVYARFMDGRIMELKINFDFNDEED